MPQSPDLGQAKAPDKSLPETSSSENANEPNQTSPTVADSNNCDNNMTSTSNTSGGNSNNNAASGASQEISSKSLKHMNDHDFKDLLEEAISYKSPKDRENTSETFRKLLEHVERTKDEFPAISEARYQRGSNNQHGGSLQDLKESGAHDMLDNDYTYGKSNRRHHHNSRTQKYSLVSTRQREGGSLPSNVNVSNCFLSNEPRFLNEVGSKRRGKAERTFSGTSSNGGQDSTLSYESKDYPILGDHTTITEIDFCEDGSQPQVDENGNAIVTKKKKKFDADRNITTVDVTKVEGYRGCDPIETLVKFIENSETTDSTKKSDKFSTVAGCKKKEKKKDKDLKKDMHKVKKSTSLEELRSCTKFDEDEKLAAGVIMRTKGKKPSNNTVTSPNDGKENAKQNSKRGERRSWGTEELTYLGENNAIEEVREKNKEKEKAKKVKDNLDKQQEKYEKLEKVEKQPQKKKKSERSLSVLSMESAQSETAEFHVVTKKKKSKKRQSLEEARITTGKIVPSFPSKPTNSGHKKYQSSNSFSNDRDAYLTAYSPHDSRRKSTSSVPPSEKSDSSDLDSVHSLPIESVSSRYQSGNTSQMQHQSYADIARTVNATKQNAAMWHTSGANQKDKWPAVSVSTLSNVTSPVTVEAPSNVVQTNPSKNRSSSAKSKSLVKDFPDLAIDRSSRMSNSYDGASSCSSSSSTSTIVKQISYSQSLGDKVIVDSTVKGASKSPTTVGGAKLTDVIRGNENVKQTLQKSKSADNERFYSAEQYPALEKTIKRHSTQNPISDIQSLQNSGSAGVLVLPTGSQVISNKQRSPPPPSSAYSQQAQQISTVITNPSCIVCPSAVSGSNSSITAPVVASSDTTAFAITANSALSDTSKIVINNNLDMNTKIAATSSSNSNNLGNMNSSSTISSIIVTNNGKKSKANTKVNPESLSPSLVEMNNAKNSSRQPQVQTNHTLVAADGAVQSEAVIQNHCIAAPTINPRKPNKLESLQPMQQQQQVCGVNPSTNRKSKKDKHQQHNLNNISGDEMSQHTSASAQGKLSNRPAVIILNDASDSVMCGGSDFTFGDFNEEELRLFDCNHHLDDSGSYNISGPDVNSSSSITSDTVHEDVHLSPHSDLGYSSSNNRSIFSESMEQNNVASMGSGSQKGGPSAYMGTETESSSAAQLTSANEYEEYNQISSSNISSLPNDSAIIMATQNCSISSQYNSSQLQPQSNSVATNLGSTNVLFSTPLSASSSSSSSSNATTNALSDNPMTSANLNEVQDSTNNETTKYDLPLTNHLNKMDSPNSDNVNISNTRKNPINNNNNSSSNSGNSETGFAPSTTNCVSTPVPNNNSLSKDATALIDICTKNNYIKRSVATGMPTANMNCRNPHSESSTIQQKSSCDNNMMMKRLRKEINIRFVAPPISHDINTTNYEKIVDFVGLAWEDIMHGVNGETEYYDGQ
ncbi:putative uncharacterized protein DDB_G0282133 isoform X2 [Hermetia illucens]|uniref:putative uncharacterized protein DDB_G0282133 isoform X2 n=1 Tax=Hermetia illucens TaxID=343691 RepID=UPI0018CC04AB|nr:putative uncharacterized protein DDB_G0282133 isoform X2 [Hermetia illucens]